MDADELEAALAHMKQMQNVQPAVVPPRLKTLICATKVVSHAKKLAFQKRKNTDTNDSFRREEPPDFLAQLDSENRDVKTELSELQVLWLMRIKSKLE